MQHGRDALHDDEDDAAEQEEGRKDNNEEDGAADARHFQRWTHCHGPQHGRELLVGEGESPQTEVGSCVGDAVKAEFCMLLVKKVLIEGREKERKGEKNISL